MILYNYGYGLSNIIFIKIRSISLSFLHIVFKLFNDNILIIFKRNLLFGIGIFDVLLLDFVEFFNFTLLYLFKRIM